MNTLFSRLNIVNIIAIITGIILMLSGQGLIAAALAGLIIHALNTFVVIRQKFQMTMDPLILAVAVLGGIISVIELITESQVFPGVNPMVWNIILGVVQVILRVISTDK